MPPPPGWAVLKVEGFGLNRSELFSRRGLSSSDFSYPRVLGLECSGYVIDPGETDLRKGDRAVALMGGMGRSFDGGYATHVTAPRSQIFKVSEDIPAETLAAIPETYNTADLMVNQWLKPSAGQTVFVHGATSALGMAAAEIAKDRGCTVIGTSRSPEKAGILEQRSRIDHTFVDGPLLADDISSMGLAVEAVVECVGSTAAIEMSAALMPNGGKIALGGQLTETWDTDPEPCLPNNVTLEFIRSDETAYPQDAERFAHIFRKVADGSYAPNIGRMFDFKELPAAQQFMEENRAIGKIVVKVD